MLLLLIIIDLFIRSHCLKIWKYDSDIMNKNNWKSFDNNNCNSIKFAPINQAPIFIDKLLITEKLILPTTGEINLIGNGRILFEKNSKCIELKSFNYHYWSDYRNWHYINDDDDDDKLDALPDLERIPCDYDNISLPAGIHSRIKFDEYFNTIKLNSIKFEQKQLNQNDLNQLLTSSISNKIFHSYYDDFNIEIDRNPHDSSVCHHQHFIACPDLDDNDNNPITNDDLKCKDPIQPLWFCRKLCGATIEFTKKSHFQPIIIEDLLQKSSILTHLSHIDENLYQITLTEHDFNGISLMEADEIYENLKSNSHHYRIKHIKLYKSGNYYLSGGTGTTLIMLFSTFLGVVVIFALIFYSFNPNNSLITRLRLGTINPGPFLARFDGRRFTLDGQSLGGSIVELDQSFDNPMYNKDRDDDDDDDVVEELH